MRDIVLTILVFGTLPFIFRSPYFGVLVWSWLSYMNPHKLCWGFAQNMPFAQIVAITLLVSLLGARQKAKLPRDVMLIFWGLFLLWMVITTIFAVYPDGAFVQLSKVLKIQLVTWLTLLLITDQKKMNQLIWVIVLSIGFFSLKGGIFTLATGGTHRVFGPTGSFIQENNTLAVATLMIMPLMFYLFRLHKDDKRIKLGLAMMVFFSVVSVFGSQSRGALVAAAAVGGFFWLKTRTKIISGMGILLAGILIFSFMPQSWHARMDTIQNYETDRSAMGRINAWQYSINVANSRLTGAGFESWSPSTFAMWAPDPNDVHAAHSIYFGVLADHGWLGLVLFLIILLLTWLRLSGFIRQTRNDQDFYEQNLLARMLQISMIAYISGGAFLSLSYFDLPWHIVAIGILLAQHLRVSSFADDKPKPSTPDWKMERAARGIKPS